MFSRTKPRRFALILHAAAHFLAFGSLAGQEIDPSAPPYIPTPMPLVERMLDMAKVAAGDVVYDLGSGDGRLVIAAAGRGARGVGIEYEAWLVERSRAAADSANVGERVSFIHGDIFDHEVTDASVVMLYLGADFNVRMRPRLLEQLRPGARVVSHGFHMGDWRPDGEETVGSGAGRATLFFWVIPARVDGFWSLEVEGLATSTLEFQQEFQMLQGELRRGSFVRRVDEGRVDGKGFRFSAVDRLGTRDTPLEFSGSLVDGRIEGIVRGPPEWGIRRWRALRFTDPALSPGVP